MRIGVRSALGKTRENCSKMHLKDKDTLGGREKNYNGVRALACRCCSGCAFRWFLWLKRIGGFLIKRNSVKNHHGGVV